MDSFLHSSAFNYILVGLVLAIGVVGYYLWNRSRKRKIPESSLSEVKGEAEEKTGIDRFVEVDARVYDNETRTVYNSTIPAETVRQIRQKHNNLGRKWFREGKWLYALNKKEDGTYMPRYATQTMEDPPSECHRALMQQEIDIFYNVESEKGFMQKWGHVLLFAGAVVFALFLFIMQRMQD